MPKIFSGKIRLPLILTSFSVSKFYHNSNLKSGSVFRGPGHNDNNTENWAPTTLDQVGKDEMFIKTILSANPQLLRLENRLSGIRAPYKAFRQLSFNTPQGRSIRPDIVYLTASGHVIITETKLFLLIY